MRVCKANRCLRKHRRLGYCDKHSQQIMKHGRLTPNLERKKYMMSDIEFAQWIEDVSVRTENGCLEIPRKYRDKKGYGYVAHQSKHVFTHRFLKEQRHGECPDGMESCHSCNNKSCQNVNHIRWDTRRSNLLDRTKAGANPYEKLDQQKVTSIRNMHRLGSKQRDIASHFGVSPATIYLVVNRKTWKHVPDSSKVVRGG